MAANNYSKLLRKETTQDLGQALIILMKQGKALEKITVTDLTARAGVSRQAFYRNFEDKYELISCYYKDFFESGLIEIQKIDEPNPDKIAQFLVTKFSERSEDFIFATTYHYHDILLKLYQEVLFRYFEPRLPQTKGMRTWQIMNAAGSYYAIIDWLINDIPKTQSELVKQISQFGLINQLVRDSFDTKSNK